MTRAPVDEAAVERVALAILNSDRVMAGFAPAESRANIPNSDGYLVNARAAIEEIAAMLDHVGAA